MFLLLKEGSRGRTKVWNHSIAGIFVAICWIRRLFKNAISATDFIWNQMTPMKTMYAYKELEQRGSDCHKIQSPHSTGRTEENQRFWRKIF
jgi:hypothetical protein